MATQANWRFCTKCYSLFFYGYGSKGVCPEGGAHSPFESESPTHAGSSWDFELTIASESPPPTFSRHRGWLGVFRLPGQLALLHQVLQPLLVGLPDRRALPGGRSAQPVGVVSEPDARGE